MKAGAVMAPAFFMRLSYFKCCQRVNCKGFKFTFCARCPGSQAGAWEPAIYTNELMIIYSNEYMSK